MKSKSIHILAIESSCDDTSAALISSGEIKSNIVASQKVHKAYGGIVPELASRKHQENIIPVVDIAMKEAGLSVKDLSAIAFTVGPGLLGSLLVGSSFAKSMALSLDIPLIAVNHMEAHVLAHFIDPPKPQFPFLCLTVSGGHTQIVRVDAPMKMEILGSTLDDAAGEAFDKIGKYLGLEYPAGPLIDQISKKGSHKYHFTKPKIKDLDFSFSGLKTAVLYFLRDQIKEDEHFIASNLADICASVQTTIVDILLDKISKAADQTLIKEIAIAGGVSANSELRKVFSEHAKLHQWNLHIPQVQYCTDNAAMIAMAAHYKYLGQIFADQSIVPDPRLKIT